MIVVDASVVVDLVLGPGSDAGDRLADHLEAGDLVCAPHLMDAEVGQALRNRVRRGELGGSEAEEMIWEFLRLPIARYEHRALLERAFAFGDNASIYDGIYLALAEALESPLLTGDARLAGVRGCDALVEVVATSAG